MKVVYSSFDGRYSDNPRAMYRRLTGLRSGDQHVWLADPAHRFGFPDRASTVTMGSPESVAALEEADLVIANTHIDLTWDKKPGALYVQTWHGTPLKRIHHDGLWAPEGRLDQLDRDVARWDYLLSPNRISTARLQQAFRFSGEVLETGYPRNDILSSSRRHAVRSRVRRSLGISDETTAVLYAPTWRDNELFAEGTPEIALDIARWVEELGGDHVLLPRLHYMMTDRMAPLDGPAVRDVSFHPDVHELYLAADVLVTDYSSVMFDFAVTGKPMIFFSYDLERYRDSVRGFYFDLEPLAPGPVVRTSDDVIAALQHLPEVRATYAERYAEFRQTFCHLEDGHAGDRLMWLADQPSREPQLDHAVA